MFIVEDGETYYSGRLVNWAFACVNLQKLNNHLRHKTRVTTLDLFLWVGKKGKIVPVLN
jgi:hypothetical protein